ncbi:MAG: hypothetical protein JWL69_4602 [Phycisphaerales bacterium]|nr:hypothetical protein [Phycisphaerales bacterium]MDB5353967.1 hypothetical protein [Phycisphaerales bacterium]
MNLQIQNYCRSRGHSRNVVDGGLEYLVSGWRDTVTRLHAGYKRGIFEYMNDLDGRSILEEVLPLATEAERRAVLDALSTLDAEFRDLTVASKVRVSESGNNRHYWWLYRLPPNVELA